MLAQLDEETKSIGCDPRNASLYLIKREKDKRFITTAQCSKNLAENVLKIAKENNRNQIVNRLDGKPPFIKMCNCGSGSIYAYLHRLFSKLFPKLFPESKIHNCATWLNEVVKQAEKETGEELTNKPGGWRFSDLFAYISEWHPNRDLVQNIIIAISEGRYAAAHSLAYIGKENNTYYLRRLIKKWFPKLCNLLGWGLSNFKDLKKVIKCCCITKKYEKQTNAYRNKNGEICYKYEFKSMPGSLIYAILSDNWRLIKNEIERVKEKIKNPSEEGQDKTKDELQKSAEQKIGKALIDLLNNLSEKRGEAFLKALKAEKKSKIKNFFKETLKFKQENFKFKEEEKREDESEVKEMSSGGKTRTRNGYSLCGCLAGFFCRKQGEPYKQTQDTTNQKCYGCSCCC